MARYRFTRVAVKEEIERAFHERQYPGDDFLIHRDMIDSPEGDHLLQVLKGRKWQTVPADDLMTIRDSFGVVNYVTDEAFAYFLPSFLVAAIWPERDVDIAGSATRYLLPVYPWEAPDEFRDRLHRHRLRLFGADQIEAIRQFLRFLESEDEEDARSALRCWTALEE